MRNSIVQNVIFLVITSAMIWGYQTQKEQYETVVKTISNNSQKSPSLQNMVSMMDTMICPPLTKVSCPEDEPPLLLTYRDFLEAGGSFMINCGIDTISFEISNTETVDEFCNKTTSTLYAINDSCDRIFTCMHVVEIRDETTPSVTCPGITVQCIGDIPQPFTSFAAWYNDLISLAKPVNQRGSLSDNCSIDTASFEFLSRDTARSGNCVSAISDRYVISDSCGNSVICNQRFSVVNNIFPTFTPARDTTLFENGQCFVDTSVSVTGTIRNPFHPCGLSNISKMDIAIPGCTGSFDIIKRVWRVTDLCGRFTIDTQFIYVRDTIKPNLSALRDTTLLCAEDIPAPAPNQVIGSDNCSNVVTISFVKDSTTDSVCINNKVFLRIYEGIDACNNKSRTMQRFRVHDSIPPLIVCPADVRILCATNTPPVNINGVNASENCTGLVNVMHVKDSISDSTCLNKKIIFRIYKATDICQNMARCTQKLSINDTVAPTVTCPSNVTLTCAASITAPNVNLITATDLCGQPVKLHVKDSVSDSTCINGKTVFRVYSATDDCGNVSKCNQRIVIDDNTLPTAQCPGDTTVTCTSLVPSVNTALVMAADNCGGIPVINFVKDSTTDSTCLHIKTISRIYSITDDCFNTIRCYQNIFVLDTIAPILTGNSNNQILTCGELFEIIFPTVEGECTETDVELEMDTIFGNCPGNFQIVLTFTSEDACMNVSERKDTVTYRDDAPPTIICAPNKRIDCFMDPILSVDSFLVNGGSFMDACGIDTSSFSLVAQTVTTIGQEEIEIRRTYAIADLCGSKDSCEQIITAPMCFADLALKAVVNGGHPYIVKPGGTVPASVILYNQGFVTTDSIKIIQYLQKGTTIASAGWIFVNDTTACTYLSIANGKLPAGGLQPGDTVKLDFVLHISPTVNFSVAITILEINEIRNTSFVLISDLDSDPDNIKTNDPGGIPLSPDDDEIDENGRVGEDEDDHDPILFYIAHPLVCISNEAVSASVNIECKGCITPYDVLKGILLPEEFYYLTIYDPFGKELPLRNCIGREYLGYTLTYKVSIPLVEPNNYCWGRIKLEDKSPPQIDCTNDTIYCYEVDSLPGVPDILDNCDGPSKVNIVNLRWIDYGCDTPGLKGVYIRSLESHDSWGNSKQCDKRYYIRKVDLDSIDCPRDTSIDCKLEVINGIRFSDPKRSGAPTIHGVKLWPNHATCNTFATYKDDTLDICGYGYKIKRKWIILDHCTQDEITCTQYIKIEDKTAPVVDTLVRTVHLVSDAHDCIALYNFDTIRVSDCSKTIQRYSFTYFDPHQINKVKVQAGTLPARLEIPIGTGHKIRVEIIDACGNLTRDSITISVTDQTPPTPVCDENTQITLDPNTCWGLIAAADLDNGSHDNCCDELHFAAAFMDEIDSARIQFARKIIADCGNKDYWDNKAWYDKYIEEWINCFVFRDTLHSDECGSRQVVLRVYEACEVPRYDPHVFACSPHAWYCYNTSWIYRVLYNYEFRPTAAKSCDFKAPWDCKTKLETHFNTLNLYNYGGYQAKAIQKGCDGLFSSSPNGLVACPRKPLYNDCMINLLLDDKSAPHCEELEDITIYCDSVPYLEQSPYDKSWNVCLNTDKYTTYPGDIKRTGYTAVYGYYSGGIKTPTHIDDHTSTDKCEYNTTDNWAPIYCRSWLELDRYDSNDKFDAKGLFYKPVKVDKKNSRRTLAQNEFYVVDNCIIQSVVSTDDGQVDICGIGWLRRTWTVTDKCGNKTTCSQKIILKHRSDFEVIFPADELVYCEDLKAKGGQSIKNITKPIVSDDDCERLGVHYTDDTFKVVNDACFKILRRWTVIDECIYEPNQHNDHPDIILNDTIRANPIAIGTDRSCVYRNIKDNGDGYMHYTQVIKIIDTAAPKLIVKDTSFCITDATCKKSLTLPIRASDNCSDDLWYNLFIDKNNDGTIDETLRSVRTLDGSYEKGIYKIRVEAFDHCYNKSESSFTLTVKDCKAPTPYCLNGIASVIMPSSGNLVIWASDFNQNSFDNCTSPNNLKFTFDTEGLYTSDTITCRDLPNGRFATITVDVYVHDESGNKDFCKTYIAIQDNGSSQNPKGACEDLEASLVAVTGELMDESKEPIEKVTVKLKSNSAGLPDYMTSTNGKYSFSNIPLKGDVTITPTRNDDFMNGVSTLDLLLIEKHIKGDKLLPSPYKIIAADVNQNASVDILDLLELRKLILGIYDQLPQSESWRFIPMAHTFADPNQPWNYPMQARYNGITKDEHIPFMGLKVGDVNNTSIPNQLLGTEMRESAGGITFKILDQRLLKGNKIKLPVTAEGFNHIYGFQGTLIHEGLELLHVLPGSLSMTKEHWNTKRDGFATFSWASTQAVAATSEDVLFTLEFKVIQSGSVSEKLAISSRQTVAESYNSIDRIQPVGIRFIDQQGAALQNSDLFQNYPNPFVHSTTIGIKLAQPGFGKLTIRDITGKTLKSIAKTWDKGYSEVRITKNELGASGVVFYTFESSQFNASRKMIVID